MPQAVTVVSNTTNTATPAATFRVEPGLGMNIYLKTTPENNGASNVVAKFNAVSSKVAGSVATTTYPFAMTNTLAGSNVTVVGVLQLTPAQLANIYALRFDYLATTQTNNVTVVPTYEVWR
jgi:hypothetical protein